ncbi:acyl-CoA synthetase (AMP-forming)/AMP-acid ligase II [Rhodococcus sp. AG1013]|uniref:class I adenylate-forming enzyme family protein n=1 Tax=Rhodococcus sp. AG1013 TaxID=2183996 RepID=UPI000E0A9405|nr:class I adenylate-forming enzyme family protein [Rhodococcus sp. AG1013]RDI18480.1 acyl-CoA synthetase (AMP-forming)/AMP-acid ligase II [Rhodococcus sp. AG1013]
MGSLKIHPQIRITEYTASGAWTPETVRQLFADRVRDRGSQLAVVDPVNKAEQVDALPRRVTWAELDVEVDRLAAVLLEAGIRAGEVIAVQLPNTVEQVVVFLASWRIGAIVSPLPVHSTDAEIVETCNESCASAFVTAGRIGSSPVAGRVMSVRPQIPTLRVVLSYGVGVPDGVVRIGHTVPTAADIERVAEYATTHVVDPNDCIAICWTAGTEGEPKGVPHAHYESLAQARALVRYASLTVDDVILNPFQMMTAAGIVGTLLPWLSVGCVLVQHQPSDLDVFLRQIAEEKVTYTAGRPAALAEIERREGPTVDLSTLTRIGVGAGPMSPDTVRKWKESYGVELINFFGTVEGVSLRSAPTGVARGQRTLLYPRAGDATRAEVDLVDGRTGDEIVVPGVPGELRVKGPTVFAGYLNPARDRDPFDEDGFLRTGDLFVIDGPGDGYLRFVDRAADLIVRDGVPIGSAELEMLIAEHPSVAEVAVVGCPDGGTGERVVAVVGCRPGSILDLDELVEHLESRGVGADEAPQRLVVSKALPRNRSGKILKRELREQLSRG